jgi:hypothetical protein
VLNRIFRKDGRIAMKVTGAAEWRLARTVYFWGIKSTVAVIDDFRRMFYVLLVTQHRPRPNPFSDVAIA